MGLLFVFGMKNMLYCYQCNV